MSMFGGRFVGLLLLVAVAAGAGWLARGELDASGPAVAGKGGAEPGQQKPGEPGKEKKTGGKKDKGPVPVSVARVERRDVPRYVEAVGQAEASERVVLRARVEGQLQALNFEEGQVVRRGQVLARLDDAEFQARLAQAEARLGQDQARLAKARGDQRRDAALQAQGFVSQDRVLASLATLDELAAAVRADEAEVALARLQLAHTQIRAPFDGVIGAKQVFAGAMIKAQDTVLAEVLRVDPLQVAFSLPERFLPELAAARRAGALAVEFGLPESGRFDWRGTVGYVDPAVEPGVGSVRLRAQVEKVRVDKAQVERPAGALAPGQFVRVRLRLAVLRQVLTVPAEAVQQGPEGSFVFVLVGADAVRMQRVTLVDSAGGVAVIGEGGAGGAANALKDTDVVITDGHVRLTPKSRVSIKPAVTAPAR